MNINKLVRPQEKVEEAMNWTDKKMFVITYNHLLVYVTVMLSLVVVSKELVATQE